MSLASYKTVVKSVTNHEQSAAKSSTVMVQRRRSSVVRTLPDYIVGPPNLRAPLTVNHVAAELLRLSTQLNTVKVVIFHKWCKIDTLLLRNTNRKCHMAYPCVLWPVTMSATFRTVSTDTARRVIHRRQLSFL